MDSLADYGSDEERAPHHRGAYSNARDADRGGHNSERGNQQSSKKEDDTNYDHVTMDMSEESNNNNSDCDSPRGVSQRRSSYSSGERDSFQGGSSPDDRNKMKTQRNYSDANKSDKKHLRNDDVDKQDKHFDRRNREGSDKRDKDYSDRRDNFDRRGTDRDRRDNDRDRYRDRCDKKYSNDDKRSNIDKRRERSRSHERNSSGSSKRRSSSGDRDRSSRSHHSRYSDGSKRSNSRERRSFKKSRSRDKSPGSSDYKPSYKVSKKMQAINKMGLQIKTPDGSIATPQMLMQQTFAEQVEKVKNATGIELPKYYNPAAMNPLKYANQIQKRKLLWGNKGKESTTATPESSGSCSGPAIQTDAASRPKTSLSKWQGTKFAQDSDGKVASKFMRLMGIKDGGGGGVHTQAPVESSGDTVKKQEEMFEAMQAQYEVARATTHTMRGVGLGFSSHNKPY